MVGSLESSHPEIYAELQRLRLTLESHYKQPCDIKLCVDEGRLYILDVRPAKMSAIADARTAIDFLAEVLISPDEAILRIPLDFLKDTLAPRIISFDGLGLLARGLPGDCAPAVSTTSTSPAAIASSRSDREEADPQGRRCRRMPLRYFRRYVRTSSVSERRKESGRFAVERGGESQHRHKAWSWGHVSGLQC